MRKVLLQSSFVYVSFSQHPLPLSFRLVYACRLEATVCWLFRSLMMKGAKAVVKAVQAVAPVEERKKRKIEKRKRKEEELEALIKFWRPTTKEGEDRCNEHVERRLET